MKTQLLVLLPVFISVLLFSGCLNWSLDVPGLLGQIDCALFVDAPQRFLGLCPLDGGTPDLSSPDAASGALPDGAAADDGGLPDAH